MANKTFKKMGTVSLHAITLNYVIFSVSSDTGN